jgi:hypothetical protein
MNVEEYESVIKELNAHLNRVHFENPQLDAQKALGLRWGLNVFRELELFAKGKYLGKWKSASAAKKFIIGYIDDHFEDYRKLPFLEES